MEIERINENTVRFFLSYVDVEERGFDREEIWYNRERSEELFWEVMDEVNEEEDFPFDGPLWIQVQAVEKGLEVLVTKAQLSKEGGRYEFPFPGDSKDMSTQERIEQLLDHHFSYNETNMEEEYEEDAVSFVVYFNDFEDVVSLATKQSIPKGAQTKLFSLKDKYYLFVEFPYELFSEEDIDNHVSVILEYSIESQRTIHYLQEYGKEIISDDVFEVINKYFI